MVALARYDSVILFAGFGQSMGNMRRMSGEAGAAVEETLALWRRSSFERLTERDFKQTDKSLFQQRGVRRMTGLSGGLLGG